MEKETNLKIFLNGIIKENPVLVLLIGMCPSLAITTMAVNGLGMGAATTFVLICSNIVISLLKKLIPDAVRLPVYIVIIAGFVTIMGFIMKKNFPELYKSLGVYLELVTVNCVILMRAESFANRNDPFKSALDGLGFGIGFTLALVLIGSFREIFGMGTWFAGTSIEVNVIPGFLKPMAVFINPAGGFFVLGVIIAAVSYISKKINFQHELKTHPSCESCGMCSTPHMVGKNHK